MFSYWVCYHNFQGTSLKYSSNRKGKKMQLIFILMVPLHFIIMFALCVSLSLSFFVLSLSFSRHNSSHAILLDTHHIFILKWNRNRLLPMLLFLLLLLLLSLKKATIYSRFYFLHHSPIHEYGWNNIGEPGWNGEHKKWKQNIWTDTTTKIVLLRDKARCNRAQWKQNKRNGKRNININIYE